MAKADMIWVDVETTGLEAGQDKILEIAVVVTDKMGEWICGDAWLVGDASYDNAFAAAKVHDIVGEMHTKNGLFKEWERARVHDPLSMRPHMVEKTALDMLQAFGIQKGSLPMAGATVHFDRKMMEVQMPRLAEWFHYRNFDISTIKQAARWHNPRCAEADGEYANDLVLHRGMDDVLWEIHEYKHYVDNFFFVAD